MDDLEVRKNTLESILKQDSISKRFNDMLGKKAAGFISSILSAVNSNAKLKEAEPMSVISAAAIAATLDLPINSNLGFAHIVPYKGKAQFQMGWKGFIQLAQRTAQYATINCSLVYEGELVEHNHFTGEMVFDQKKKENDTIIGYVAYFKLLNGFHKWFYMTKKEAEAHGKKYSQSYSREFGRWKQDFDSMALKTVIKLLLSKYGILSIGMETAIQADQAVISSEGEYEYIDNEERSAATELMEEFKKEPEKKEDTQEKSTSRRRSSKPAVEAEKSADPADIDGPEEEWTS